MSPNELQELQTVAEALNAESSEINTTIAALNAKLAAMTIGQVVWLSPDEDHYQIGFAKVEEKWQLAVRWCKEIKWVPDDDRDYNYGEYETVPGTGYNVTPLLQASRELRIRALRYMPSLIDNLKYETKKSLDAARAAKKLAAVL
jgi:hypothetical protein